MTGVKWRCSGSAWWSVHPPRRWVWRQGSAAAFRMPKRRVPTAIGQPQSVPNGLPRAGNKPRSRKRASRSSNQRCARPPARSRSRHARRLEKSNPGSTWSTPSRYFQPVRLRTASGACRSERFAAHGKTATSVRRPGNAAGGPRLRNKSAKTLSAYIIARASRRGKDRLPFGKAAHATWAVASGMYAPDCGHRDMALSPQTMVVRMALILPGFLEKEHSPNSILNRGEIWLSCKRGTWC
jgi:hypothetical protein